MRNEKSMGKNNLEELVEMYEASGDELDLENRLRYAMAKTMCCGKEANTPDMREILTTLAAPEHQTAKQLRAKLTRLFVMADLTGSELTSAFAGKVFAGKPGSSSGNPEE